MNDKEFSENYKKKFIKTIGDKINQKSASGGQDSYLWLRIFGIIGWSVVVPVLIGVALGLWVDKTVHLRFSFTLTLLLTGMVLGCLNAWYSIKNIMK